MTRSRSSNASCATARSDPATPSPIGQHHLRPTGGRGSTTRRQQQLPPPHGHRRQPGRRGGPGVDRPSTPTTSPAIRPTVPKNGTVGRKRGEATQVPRGLGRGPGGSGPTSPRRRAPAGRCPGPPPTATAGGGSHAARAVHHRPSTRFRTGSTRPTSPPHLRELASDSGARGAPSHLVAGGPVRGPSGLVALGRRRRRADRLDRSGAASADGGRSTRRHRAATSPVPHP